MKQYTAEDIVKLLRQSPLKQIELARAIGVSPQYLSDVLHGRRAPGPAILRYLKLTKRVIYQ